ncbi:uncharacterized protein PITG_09902 [Phytophthora infestans T30-4]|uniref:Tc1-like transposase DDE domain-containing protein n=1 Tax=Phytophthora infestans (strain T30-4) TaxID=403677 RepID=D0NDT6_PHYIT|nr:uncharacterized protein PITG_09902 [Phytophthora infestans T30-4]EEY56381.1 conserved hypothetical protein [Phytophthora infestans T30-4]|eukprot:XP_002902455.1 conserved hypothetical protein [Phytophthora infestans T30-4]
MPRRYARYALETKLRVLEVARRGGVWEETAEELGVNYNTTRAWVAKHVMTPTSRCRHVNAVCFTLKQMHKEPQYMNTMTNKQKRRTYLAELQEYQAMGKVILYMDEANFNLWSTRTRGRSLRGRRAVKKVTD